MSDGVVAGSLPVRSRSSVRRSLPLGSLALAAALLAGPARAEEVHHHYTGKVSVVAVAIEDTKNALASHGVVVDAPATVDFSYESTTPLTFSADTTSIYAGAVTNLTISIGTYVAQPDAGASSNSASVDDKPQGGASGVDSFVVTRSGEDTDGIMTVDKTSLSMTVTLNDFDGSAFSTQALVQDLSKMEAGLVGFGSGQGMVFIILDVGDGGPGPGIGGSALARKGQITAAKNFGRAVLAAERKHAAAPPEKDPFGDKKNQAIDKAYDKFLVNFVNAVNKALRQGGTAPLPADAKGEAADSVLAGCGELVESLLTGALPDDKNDRALRGKLIKAAAVQLGADLVAHAKDVVNLKPDKLADKLAKSHDKLLAAVDKALDKAEMQGLDYAGPGGGAIADAVTAIVDAYVELTLGAG